MAEAVVRRLQGEYLDFQKERLNRNFFTSCVSEGFIPKGMRSKFNLARDVNNKNLIENIQDNLNVQGSRILNHCLKSTENKCNQYFDIFEKWQAFFSYSMYLFTELWFLR